MTRYLAFAIAFIFNCAIAELALGAQIGESKIAVLDSLPASERQAKLVEGARADGEVVIYLNLDLIVTNALTDAFKKKYPFVQPRVARFSGASIIPLVATEA